MFYPPIPKGGVSYKPNRCKRGALGEITDACVTEHGVQSLKHKLFSLTPQHSKETKDPKRIEERLTKLLTYFFR